MKPLPPSQVVCTAPRGGVAGQMPQLTVANPPPIASAPAANAIQVANSIVDIPR
ncbi:D-(-)-3-hydroxybutyrate oligomer hydrolase [Burkholderia cenocepacia]|nr:3HB-oligomer hydrolase (3HBOH) domain protein [Burkholderia cenocepacia K56-2Valvano]KKI82314.1 D-(-)-3-hydroxybutyrate oligomer hydrolase [Burkholderia cenocepacia]MCW3640038.1 D-(-)-3-hydroxybutyrate oligomer hydrolase [Burkholderia cenocepacia]ONR64989.1 D-(-)-3-hydroxybutyrate oligomer hydrolase [Burkholderia cenocepacia]ONR65346.1 D-(-)-3-hydroxybutyrate oligomer hydrolase [Burkholderia cenocepacia]